MWLWIAIQTCSMLVLQSYSLCQTRVERKSKSSSRKPYRRSKYLSFLSWKIKSNHWVVTSLPVGINSQLLIVAWYQLLQIASKIQIFKVASKLFSRTILVSKSISKDSSVLSRKDSVTESHLHPNQSSNTLAHSDVQTLYDSASTKLVSVSMMLWLLSKSGLIARLLVTVVNLDSYLFWQLKEKSMAKQELY